jgi:ketosteroid isomerase-like protein
LITVVFLSGCSQGDRVRFGRSGDDSERQIRSVLKTQVGAWNRGDVDAFMTGYWKSPELAFVSGDQMTLGWQATLDRYHQRYPTRDAMGELAFSELRVRELSNDAALVSGRWQLDREEPIGGRFTLLFRKLGGRWIIVYDHTSVGAKS